MANENESVLLRMEGIVKEFPGVKALNGVNLTVRAGTVHALMGENGAGKSTLMKCLFGVYHKDAGHIYLEGKEVDFKNSKNIIGGIALIVLLILFGLRNPGYTITFDSTGGTPVESQRLMYGDYIAPPADPTREGFRFVGWYRDVNGNYPWDMELNQVSEAMTLYAVWEEK